MGKESNNATLNYKVKKILEDIIDVAYQDTNEPLKERYKKFYIKFLAKELKSVSGRYYPNERKIEIYNLSRSPKLIIKTCLHELAHHIDYMNRHNTDHTKLFYDVYAILLYAALNMKIFTPYDMLVSNTASDKNKVIKIIDEWIPNYVLYKDNIVTFFVFSSFEFKEDLKIRGYKWDKLENCWYKDIFKADQGLEIQFLKERKCKYKMNEFSDIKIEAFGYLMASGKTFACKEQLKEEDFKFDMGKKAWKKKINLTESKKIIFALKLKPVFNEVEFTIMK